MAHYQRRSPLGIIPHDAFLRMSGSAELTQFRDHPHIKVAGKAAFVRMQEHLDQLYAGIDVLHSYEDAGGQIFDCIPIAQQPGLRGASGPMPTPPDMSSQWGLSGDVVGVKNPVSLDRHGNPRECPSGAIPMRRIMLEELIRFQDLDTFFRKHPNTVVSSSPLTKPSTPVTGGNNHRYAVGYQQVGNVGGTSYVSVHQPTVNSNEVFSLAQQWYSGGSGSNLQTVEVGWQVYPGKYQNASPNLFIYYTPDGYATGSYNLDTNNTFVQTHNTYQIGGALPSVSVPGGAQQFLRISVYKASGAWWIYLNGLTNDDILGYYPTTLFGSGQMATSADTIEYGGETVSGNPPSGDWGPMGTGAPASEGWQHSAFQGYIYYWGTDNTANWASLTEVTPVSPCYSFSAGLDQSWGSYFYFGGAGGGDC